MSPKFRRNDPCWCGSGKKYKYCHYRRELEELTSQQDYIETITKGFRKKECLHPEAPNNCQGGVIRAHTIQRNGGLSKIAKDGHVYTGNTQDFSTRGKLGMHKKGIKEASTFTGFCKYHDNLLFSPIEDQPLKICEEHAFLLSYRAISHELYMKRRLIEINKPLSENLDKGVDLEKQKQIQEALFFSNRGVRNAIRNFNFHKNLLDEGVRSKNYSNVKYYCIVFNNIPDFLCSGAIYPIFDFHGNKLQDLSETEKILDLLTLSLLTSGNGGVAYFSWVGEGQNNQRFIESLHAISDDDIPHALLRFTFGNFSNVFLSPDWWDGLSNKVKERIMTRYGDTEERLINSKHLNDDGLRAISWKVISRETNLQLNPNKK